MAKNCRERGVTGGEGPEFGSLEVGQLQDRSSMTAF